MKKYLFILFLLFFKINTIQAQKELWGNNDTQSYIDYSNPAAPVTVPYYGNISKFDINGQNGKVVHVFDGINGKLPKGKLFQASNGKLYGMTSIYTSSTAQNSDACLFEYDLVLNKFRIVHTFDHTLYYTQDMSSGVVEGLPNKLFGGIGNHLFSYDLMTEDVTMGSLSDYFFANLRGELVIANDGFLYGSMLYNTICPQGNSIGPYQGMIIKINPTSYAYNLKYSFVCDTSDGVGPTGDYIVNFPNKLYGTSLGGGGFYNAGTLYEYNFTTNTFAKKVTFDENNLGSYVRPLVQGNSDNLYGVCTYGGTNIYIDPFSGTTSTNHYGTLFEYNVANNTITKLHDFGSQTNPPNSFTGVYPKSIMKASTGYYFGINDFGIFKFNPIDNSVVMTTPIGCTTCPVNEPLAFVAESLIEICRKPSYQEFVVDTFDACVGSTFTYDVQNTNATSYQWLKNNVNVVGQTTGILNLTNLTANDAGNYTCLMTNECGTTTTMVLHLTVSCLGTNTVASLEKGITLYPNPAKNILNLKLPENIDVNVTSVSIANSLGQIVLKQKTENTTTIDVSNLQKGIYIVSLTTNYGSWNGKFVKD